MTVLRIECQYITLIDVLKSEFIFLSHNQQNLKQGFKIVLNILFMCLICSLKF